MAAKKQKTSVIHSHTRSQKQAIQNETGLQITTTGAIVEQLEITEITKLSNSHIDSKSPLRVPEALNLQVLETLSDDDDNNGEQIKAVAATNTNQQSMSSEVQKETSIVAVPHEKAESPHVVFR